MSAAKFAIKKDVSRNLNTISQSISGIAVGAVDPSIPLEIVLVQIENNINTLRNIADMIESVLQLLDE
tara:strand:- start:137 stop:340 length:204 start_codon:yes stop_codon:yes gene_type:complete